MEKQLHSVGRYKEPQDNRKPYWAKVHWFVGHPPVEQPLTEGDFFMLIGRIFGKYGPIMLDVELDTEPS